MAYQDDEYYIGRIVEHNDQVAFTHLMHKHQVMVYNLARRLTRSAADAEEVAQDTFVKVYRSLSGFRGDSKFTSWLYRITWNLALNKYKRKTHISGSTDEESFIEQPDDGTMDVVDRMDQAEKDKFVKMAIEDLDPEDRFIVTLFYNDDQPVNEIASVTGMSESNVKVRLFRARKKIKEYLIGILDEELHLLLG
jgi:RNA polymerase sigma-70 factor (ECF subfamily)